MAGTVKNGREKTDLFAASHMVRFWHIADMLVALRNVRFWE